MSMQFNDGFFEHLSRSPGITGLCVEAAEKVAGIARSTADVDSGDYRDEIIVRTKYQRRTVVQVVATNWKSMIIESRTGNLARALRAAKRGS